MKIQLIVQENVTIEQIRAFKPKWIFYGANTCWWTHDPGHLGQTKVTETEIKRTAEMFRLNSALPNAPLDHFYERARRAHGRGLPCDPTGGVLFQTDDAEGFLKSAAANISHYGKHGLRAFMAAHHSNSFGCPADKADLPAIYTMPHWASVNWADYNDALDRLDAKTP